MAKPSDGLINLLRNDNEHWKRREEKFAAEIDHKAEFVAGLVEYFSNSELIEFLQRRRTEIPLIVHYRSSMGAAMTGSPPDYELYICEKGLCVKTDGQVRSNFPLPPVYEAWYRAIPYGGFFHDSSDGEDITWMPSLEKTIERIERSIKKAAGGAQ
jgi:hypothetical protein